jgi:hypothetical protein
VLTHARDGFARELADQVCFLHDGLILEHGDPARIFTAPEQPEMQRFLHRLLEAGRLVLAVLAPERVMVADPRTGHTRAREVPGGTLCHGPVIVAAGRIVYAGARGGRPVALSCRSITAGGSARWAVRRRWSRRAVRPGSAAGRRMAESRCAR